jgi:hypothetical protein
MPQLDGISHTVGLQPKDYNEWTKYVRKELNKIRKYLQK